MFDRGNSNGSYQQEKALSVRLELEDGRLLQGNIVVSHSASLKDVINDSRQYLEFVTFGGKQQYISKQSIVQIEKVETPEEADQMMRRFRKLNAYSPYAVLGLAPDAGREEIQAAYHRMAKDYHPDKFVNAELPSEAMQYMIAMSKRINVAYTQLSEVSKPLVRAE